jgi:hypothetical protein
MQMTNLEDDRSGDVRHDAEAEDRVLAEAAAGEHRDEAEDAFLGAAHGPGHRFLVDDRQRNVEADAVDGEEQKRDEDLLAEFLDLEDGDEAAVPQRVQNGIGPSAIAERGTGHESSSSSQGKPSLRDG